MTRIQEEPIVVHVLDEIVMEIDRQVGIGHRHAVVVVRELAIGDLVCCSGQMNELPVRGAILVGEAIRPGSIEAAESAMGHTSAAADHRTEGLGSGIHVDTLLADAGITRGTIPELDPPLTLKDQILNPDVAAAKTDLGVPMQDERELTRVRLSSVIVVEA